jgi:hypothetical protein
VSSHSGSTLVGRGSQKAQRLTEAVSNANQNHALGPKSRRAVVYRRARLGASFGLAHPPRRSCVAPWSFAPAIQEPRPTKVEDENDRSPAV